MVMSNAANDEELMLAYRGGDLRAFETLYGRHKSNLYRYFMRQCRIPAVAEELFQDVWASLIKARERYEPRAKFTTYLFRVAHNHLIDYYRRQASGVPISYDREYEAVVESLPDPLRREAEQALDEKRRVRQLLALIEKLPDAQREALLLREEGGLSLEEIADATGVNMETAKSRLRYAVAKLREGMRKEPGRGGASMLSAKPGEEAESW